MGNKFSKNLKFLREKKGISKNKLGELVGVNQTTIGRWENEEITPSIDNVEEVARVLNIDLPDLLIKDLSFDNGDLINIPDDTIQIPVLGTIKAGMPIEAQQEILEYIEIPKKWTAGGKKFYGLKISGDSMFPKYQEGDIVIFEQNEDKEMYNGKDCAVMVNGDDATFKKVLLSDSGITLVPYNTARYDIMMYSNDDIANLPIRIIGIAREKRTKL